MVYIVLEGITPSMGIPCMAVGAHAVNFFFIFLQIILASSDGDHYDSVYPKEIPDHPLIQEPRPTALHQQVSSST